MEETAYVQWMQTSLYGYPAMLTGHAIGLSLTVGIALMADLRLLGLYPTIPLTRIRGLLGIAWAGIVLNTVTGLMIFPTQATTYVANIAFLTKMLCVVLGAVTVFATQRILARDGAAWEAAGQVGSNGRTLALGSVVFWVMAVATGRLIAYI
jgi:hypothetical protein